MRAFGAILGVGTGAVLAVFIATLEAGTIGLGLLVGGVATWIVYGLVTTIAKRFAT